MKKLLLLFLPLLLCTCISRDYRYYVDLGDRILEGFPADSPAHLRYTSDEMCIYRETIAGESGDYTIVSMFYSKRMRIGITNTEGIALPLSLAGLNLGNKRATRTASSSNRTSIPLAIFTSVISPLLFTISSSTILPVTSIV